MEAGKRTISDIFNGNRKMIIPFFQRTYVWKEEQWSRLIEDMEYISKTSKEYFLGSIILKSHPTPSNGSIGDVRTVIDGQQRLTTMAIFLKVLGLKTNQNNIVERLFTLDDGSIAMQHSQGDFEAFNRVMNLTELEDIDPVRSNILNAYNFFKENVDENKLSIQRIRNFAQFVGIDLTPTEDEQQTIAQYDQLWRPAFELDDDTRDFWEQDVTSGRIKRNNIEAFLSAYLQIKVQDPIYAVKSEDKVLYRRTEGLFNNYKSFLADYVATSEMDEYTKKQKIDEFIYDLTQYSKIYRT